MKSCSFLAWVSAWVWMLIICVGCTRMAPGDGDSRNVGRLDIGIKNGGTKQVEEANVRFGEYVFHVGSLPPGRKKVHVGSRQDIPVEAVVQYSLPDGRTLSRLVPVVACLPTNRVDMMLFVINSDQDVTVEFLQFNKVNGKWTLNRLP